MDGDMNFMFYGCDGRSIDHLLGGGRVDNILISAGMLWTGRGFRSVINLPEYDRLFLDSGGYSVICRFGCYPFAPEEYAALGARLMPEHMAVMDYPCTMPGSNPREMIARTIAASAACQAIDGHPWVQVVQGRSIADYIHCSERIIEAGLATDPIAVGSLVGRRSADEVAGILSAVAARFPDARLHGFGVSLGILKDRRVRSLLWSSDTAAWRMSPGDEMRFPRTAEEKIRNYATYRSRIDALIAHDLGQMPLCMEAVLA